MLEYSMIVRLLSEHHLEILSLKGGCVGSSESTFVKTPHCWKAHVTAHMRRKEQEDIYKSFQILIVALVFELLIEYFRLY